jgi:hypothetical protein
MGKPEMGIERNSRFLRFPVLRFSGKSSKRETGNGKTGNGKAGNGYRQKLELLGISTLSGFTVCWQRF